MKRPAKKPALPSPQPPKPALSGLVERPPADLKPWPGNPRSTPVL
jgi:hypothetical protein